MIKSYFGVNLRKVREYWSRNAGLTQEGFAGYTRTMIQTYEQYRVDPPLDLIFWLSENTGISVTDVMTREILVSEIVAEPLIDKEKSYPTEVMKERKLKRVDGMYTVSKR